MKGIMDKLVRSLVALLLPRLLVEVTKAIEEVVKTDLNGDGVVGFGKEAP